MTQSYKERVLSLQPVAYYRLDELEGDVMLDSSGFGRHGTYVNAPALGRPGALASDDNPSVSFDGLSQFATVPDSPAFAIGPNGLTVECWINPDSTAMPRQEDSGYVHWMGRLDYNPSPDLAEWVMRMYQDGNSEGRANAISSYAFSKNGGKGSSADSPFSSHVTPGEWLHVVGVYTPCTPSSLTAARLATSVGPIPVADCALFPSSGIVLIATGNANVVSYAYTGKSAASGPGNLTGVTIDNNGNAFAGTHASGTKVWRSDQGHRLYINGLLVASVDNLPLWQWSATRYGTFAVTPFHNAMPLRLGNVTDSYWQGRIDEVALYARVLTNAEIAGNFEAARTVVVPGVPVDLEPASFSSRLYESLAPRAALDEENGWSLLILCNAIGEMFQLVEDWVRDTPDAPGWSLLLDLERCPDEALPWLAQFVGVRVVTGSTPDEMRARIASTDGFKRGTRAAMVGAARATLTGQKRIVFRERNGDPAIAPDFAYYLGVLTYKSETPLPLLSTTPTPLTVSGNEITDATRAAKVQGDGRSSDSSFGIWPAARNALPKGGFEQNDLSDWEHDGTLSAAASSPERPKFGARSYRGVVASAPSYIYWATGVPVTPGQAWCISCWVNIPRRKDAVMYMQWRDAAMAAISAPQAFQTVEAGVDTRLVMSGVAPAGAAFLRPVFMFSGMTPGDVVYWDGAQSELGLFPTPYIETNGAAANRNAAAVRAPATVLNPAQGGFVARIRVGFPSTDPAIHIAARWRDATNAENYTLHHQGGTGWTMRRRSADVPVDAVIAAAFQPGASVTVVGKWGSGQIGISVDGSPFVLAAIAAPANPASATFGIGCDPVALDQQLAGEVFWFATLAEKLSDADAAAIHAFGDAGPAGVDELPGHATLLWKAEDATALVPQYATPDLSPTYKALVSQKPGGIVLDYHTADGQDWQLLRDNNATWADVKAKYATWTDVLVDTPT